MRVLVAEDHPRLATAVAEGLRREGMAVDLAFDGADALAHVGVNRYDVIVLDRDLPAVHGDQVCRKLVAQRVETRVLMLTAASTIRDRVEGLDRARPQGGLAMTVSFVERVVPRAPGRALG